MPLLPQGGIMEGINGGDESIFSRLTPGASPSGPPVKGILDGKEIAVKKLYNYQRHDGNFNECINLMRVQHQNIVRLIGYCYKIEKIFGECEGKYVFADDEERVLCLEYLKGGNLDDYISEEPCRLDWCICYGIIKGICEGLKYLHTGFKTPIYHMDLKPANILLDIDMVPKIGDFGLSMFLSSKLSHVVQNLIGTRGYMPPEYIRNQLVTSKFDVFSLGVVILQIVAGRTGCSQREDMPSEEFIELVHGKWEKRLQATSSSDASLEVKTCIKIALRCVDNDRAKRPTIAEIVDKMNKIETSKCSSSCEVIHFRSMHDPKEQCSSSENCGVTVPVPNGAEELRQIQTTGYLAMPRPIHRSVSLRTLITRRWLIRFAIWLSVAAVLAAIIVLVLHFDIIHKVKDISLRMLIWLHGICMWLIVWAVWLGVAVLLIAIIILVLYFVVVPGVKAILPMLRKPIVRSWLIDVTIVLSVAMVLAVIILLVLNFVVVPTAKAVLLLMLIIRSWLIRLAILLCDAFLALWFPTIIIIIMLCLVAIPEVKAALLPMLMNCLGIILLVMIPILIVLCFDAWP